MTNGQGLQLIEPLRSLYKDEVRGTYQFFIFLFFVFQSRSSLNPFRLEYVLAEFIARLVKNERANIFA